jgi:formate--tetrahydrofolate ligase
LERYESWGIKNLAVCMAKTQASLSDDPALLARPKGFVVKIREIRLSRGAGFFIPIAGRMMTMPGLPKVPAANSIDIDKGGKTVGLF